MTRIRKVNKAAKHKDNIFKFVFFLTVNRMQNNLKY